MSGNDPRVGSARDNSTSPKISRLASGTNSSSISDLVATLVPVLVISAVCIIVFVFLRRKCPRVYSPRSFLKSLEPQVLGVICVVGIVLLWPILLPLHATGGGGNGGLDLLTLGNVTDPRVLYAHALLAWIYFVFILYMTSRECIYYINLRQAYLLSPFYANRLSSRTVLYMNVPRQYLDEERLKWVLGKSVKRIWLPQSTSELENLIKEREQTAMRLEKAEFHLIRLANAARTKALRKGEPEKQDRKHSPPQLDSDPDEKRGESGSESPDPKTIDFIESPNSASSSATLTTQQLPDVNGSVASQWISHSSRPHHRPIANYGRRVDTIKWTRNQIKRLNIRIAKVRREQLFRPQSMMHSVFVEFETHTDAQNAYQTLTHHRPLHMSHRLIGVRPFEIVWHSLSMSWWEAIVRKFVFRAAITTMIIFWSIPSALVGTISNIEYLSKKVFFLHWIALLPKAIQGILSGVLPAVALSLLMSIVPGILRYLAKLSGVPTLTRIELFVQHAYFAFQVVQVFLITTLTSAASAAVTKLLEDPTTAESLLSQNLPKASNFYLSYFLVQSLLIGSGALAQPFSLFRFHVQRRFLNDPRKQYTRWHRLQRIHWGSVFPVYTNLGVITLSYALIAPVVLGFAAVGVGFLHVVYRYNLIYVYDSEIDTKGLVYPRALLQMILGLYFAEICMIGLFGLRSAIGPVVLTAILLVITVLVHISLIDAVRPFLNSLPKTLTVEEDRQHLLDTEPPNHETSAMGRDQYDRWAEPWLYDPEQEGEEHILGSTRGAADGVRLEGARGAVDTLTDGFKTIVKKKIEKDHPEINAQLGFTAAFFRRWIRPDPAQKSNWLLRWLHPEIYSDYTVLRRLVPEDLPDPKYPEELERDIYFPPSFLGKPPTLWIPKDPGGISRQEVDHTKKVIPVTDEYVSIDEDGRLNIDLDEPRLVFDIDRLRY
ncbi:hypothetical protein LTS13_007962 [Exophiala xenobiotica]|nr:hypothetical protein LTR41_002410 [Exophiala xenobiotica]KAK5543365.1 hypothetical protein LTR23_004842 [Chaetothyriales sp. CCFEE 6169]KAK5249934.1 hypothetical protein LTS06_005289 [Exophiala xenobiotica]KAK5367109.1 hypothetical protein LTS13_007962 [Exophiala xenobiotica]KAK5401878.1 hypothetical protein LTR06_010796 [Exophiala xenobiotica]